MVKICPNCGEKNFDDAWFCMSCTAKLGKKTYLKDVDLPSAENESEHQYSQPQSYINTQNSKKPKKMLVIILTIIIVAVAIASIIIVFGGFLEDELSHLGYSNREYGFGFNPPDGWIKLENYEGMVVSFSSPLDNSFDTYCETFGVNIEQLYGLVTLEQYKELAVNALEILIPEFNLTGSNETTIAGNPAYELVYTVNMDGNRMKNKQILTIKNNIAYIFTFSAEEDRYSDYLGTINGVINSFQIISL